MQDSPQPNPTHLYFDAVGETYCGAHFTGQPYRENDLGEMDVSGSVRVGPNISSSGETFFCEHPDCRKARAEKKALPPLVSYRLVIAETGRVLMRGFHVQPMFQVEDLSHDFAEFPDHASADLVRAALVYPVFLTIQKKEWPGSLNGAALGMLCGRIAWTGKETALLLWNPEHTSARAVAGLKRRQAVTA